MPNRPQQGTFMILKHAEVTAHESARRTKDDSLDNELPDGTTMQTWSWAAPARHIDSPQGAGISASTSSASRASDSCQPR
jgi:hypothetical protein